MYHNWVEIRSYMLEHQKELIRLADASRASPGKVRRRVSAEARKLLQRLVTFLALNRS